jgi:hypothetical protein
MFTIANKEDFVANHSNLDTIYYYSIYAERNKFTKTDVIVLATFLVLYSVNCYNSTVSNFDILEKQLEALRAE